MSSSPVTAWAAGLNSRAKQANTSRLDHQAGSRGLEGGLQLVGMTEYPEESGREGGKRADASMKWCDAISPFGSMSGGPGALFARRADAVSLLRPGPPFVGQYLDHRLVIHARVVRGGWRSLLEPAARLPEAQGALPLLEGDAHGQPAQPRVEAAVESIGMEVEVGQQRQRTAVEPRLAEADAVLVHAEPGLALDPPHGQQPAQPLPLPGAGQEEPRQQPAVAHGKADPGVHLQGLRPGQPPLLQNEAGPPARLALAVGVPAGDVVQAQQRPRGIEAPRLEVALAQPSLQAQVPAQP